MNDTLASDPAHLTHTPQRGVLLVTNDHQEPGESYGFTAALTLAAKSAVPVTLYDRSEETWGDSQHPEGPLQAGDSALEDRASLARQVHWFDEHEVTGQAWVATLPSISAVLTALAQTDADVVVVPADFGRNLFERMLEGSSLAQTISEQIRRNPEIDAIVFEVDENGTMRQVDSDRTAG